MISRNVILFLMVLCLFKNLSIYGENKNKHEDILDLLHRGSKYIEMKNYEKVLLTYKEIIKKLNESNIDSFWKIFYLYSRHCINTISNINNLNKIFKKEKQANNLIKKNNLFMAKNIYFEIYKSIIKKGFSNIPSYSNNLENDFLLNYMNINFPVKKYDIEKISKEKKNVKNLSIRGKNNKSIEKLGFHILKTTFQSNNDFNLLFSNNEGLKDKLVFYYEFKKNKNIIIFNFELVNNLNSKILIKGNIELGSLKTLDVFQKITDEIGKDFKYYSNTLGSPTIFYNRKLNKEIKKSFINKIKTNMTWKNYLQNKILAIEKNIIKDFVSKNTLKSYDKGASEIISFNKNSFPKKISLKKYLLKNKLFIQKKIKNISEVNRLLKKLNFQLSKKNYADYLNIYYQLKKVFSDLKYDFSELKDIIAEMEPKLKPDRSSKNKSNKIFIGLISSSSNEYKMENSSDLEKAYGLNMLYQTTDFLIFNKNIMAQIKLHYFIPRKGEFYIDNNKYAEINQNKSLDIIFAGQWETSLSDFEVLKFLNKTKIGINVGFGINYSQLKLSSDTTDNQEGNFFGYKIISGFSIEKKIGINWKFEFFYEYGKTENILYRGFNVGPLTEILKF